MSRDTAHGVLIHYNDILPQSLVDLPGEEKVQEREQHQIQNTSTFYFSKEDHTLGSLLQKKLHENPMVAQAGYRVPHPTKHNIEVRIHTASDGSERAIPKPSDALNKAIESCCSDLANFRSQFVASAKQQHLDVDPNLE
eukprot:GFYU01026415.1.p2 GENE.GFYU01026415.1~~GFYU01026415.1.p2  ORF type:complete len:139 (-),score=13.77 GFYU01026415.1:36-452(-)